MNGVDGDDFFEDDEPLIKVQEAFERGEKRVTIPPAINNGHTQYFVRPLVGLAPRVQESLSDSRVAGTRAQH
ncbi:hypothetical protein GCM10009681_27030 [Luedemannella helvata]|uniref:Uncharacterized protein n=1 Tax=Luedemannella helvata TaxID=349315 RepID=A0ABP4WH43_9ACTN